MYPLKGLKGGPGRGGGEGEGGGGEVSELSYHKKKFFFRLYQVIYKAEDSCFCILREQKL